MNRVPSAPQRFAQSKTARCSGRRCGAPSIVCVPQIVRLRASICRPFSPSTRRPLNFSSARAFSALIPSPVRMRSGIDHAVNANDNSKTVGKPFSTLTNSALVKPFSSRNSLSVWLWNPTEVLPSVAGIFSSRVRVPITYLRIASVSLMS